MHYCKYPSPLGILTIVSANNSIVGLWIEGQHHFCENFNLNLVTSVSDSILKAARKWLDDYFEGKNPNINVLSLAPGGSVFQQTVWRHLLEIPYGSTTTYGQLATRIATERGVAQMSAQAVGGAISRNPISIIIPCHRVIGINGSLTGYAGGIEKKRWLLQHEGVLVI